MRGPTAVTWSPPLPLPLLPWLCVLQGWIVTVYRPFSRAWTNSRLWSCSTRAPSPLAALPASLAAPPPPDPAPAASHDQTQLLRASHRSPCLRVAGVGGPVGPAGASSTVRALSRPSQGEGVGGGAEVVVQLVCKGQVVCAALQGGVVRSAEHSLYSNPAWHR